MGSRLIARRQRNEITYSVSSSQILKYAGEEVSAMSMRDLLAEINEYESVRAIFCASVRYSPAKYRSAPLDVYSGNMNCFARFLEILNNALHVEVIHLSSQAVYGSLNTVIRTEDDLLTERDFSDGEYFYALAKLNQEQLISGFCKRKEINVSVLRLPSIYGPGSTRNLENAHVIPALILKLLDNPTSLKAMGTGFEIRDFLYVDDLVDIIDMIYCTGNFDLYNISNRKFYTIRDVVDEIVSLLDITPDVYFSDSGTSDIFSRQVSADKFTARFQGFHFTEFTHGLGETISWYKKNVSSE